MRLRSSYLNAFKAQVVQEHLKSGATVLSVAISHSINAKAIGKWMPLYLEEAAAALPALVPLILTTMRPVDGIVTIELPYVKHGMTLKQPATDPTGCACFDRELLG